MDRSVSDSEICDNSFNLAETRHKYKAPLC